METILSIIIPTYNSGRLLAEMLDCCLQQTYQNWEVIIVDDLSTDETLSIVRSYVLKDSRIRLFQRDRGPKGSVVCRNIGFKHAVGKYIIHFDADDLISDTCFENRVKFMESNPDCDYASFPAVVFFDKEHIPSWTEKTSKFGISYKRKELLIDFLCAEFPFSCWCNIYRKESIEEIMWDENVLVYSDFSYIVPCILQGLKHKFSCTKEYDYFYRQFYNGTNMCANFTSEGKHKSTLYLFSKTQKLLQQREDYRLLSKYYLVWTIIHYERLLVSANQQFVNEFIHEMSYYYNRFIICKCEFLKLFMKIHNVKVRTIVIDFLMSILFTNIRLLKKSVKTMLY